MASSDSAVKIVDYADVADDAPLVKVESVEKSSFFSFLTGSKEDENGEVKTEDSKPAPDSEKKETESAHHHKEVVHEGDGVKTTYDVEEDVPPSLLEQVKRKIHWNGR